MPAAPENRQFLRNIPLFADLSEDELDLLAGLLKQREFAKEGVILRQADKGDALYVIVKGSVRVLLTHEKGREIILSSLHGGDFFGEMSLLDGAPRSASVIAQEPAKLLILERRDFMEQVMRNPKIALKVLEEMSRRLREADEKIGSLALLDVFGRLARLLLQLAKGAPRFPEGGVVVEKRPTHQEIAAMIGTSRETVSRALSEFARRGLIRMVGKQIVIPEASLTEWEDQGSSER